MLCLLQFFVPLFDGFRIACLKTATAWTLLPLHFFHLNLSEQSCLVIPLLCTSKNHPLSLQPWTPPLPPPLTPWKSPLLPPPTSRTSPTHLLTAGRHRSTIWRRWRRQTPGGMRPSPPNGGMSGTGSPPASRRTSL